MLVVSSVKTWLNLRAMTFSVHRCVLTHPSSEFAINLIGNELRRSCEKNFWKKSLASLIHEVHFSRRDNYGTIVTRFSEDEEYVTCSLIDLSYNNRFIIYIYSSARHRENGNKEYKRIKRSRMGSEPFDSLILFNTPIATSKSTVCDNGTLSRIEKSYF